MDYLIKALEVHIDDKIYFKKDTDSDSKSLISLKFNEREGHYLLITTRRCDILKANIAKNKITKLKI